MRVVLCRSGSCCGAGQIVWQGQGVVQGGLGRRGMEGSEGLTDRDLVAVLGRGGEMNPGRRRCRGPHQQLVIHSQQILLD